MRDYESQTGLLAALAFAFAAVVLVIVLAVFGGARVQDAEQRMDDMTAQAVADMAKHQSDIERLDATLKALPLRSDLAALEVRIEALEKARRPRYEAERPTPVFPHGDQFGR